MQQCFCDHLHAPAPLAAVQCVRPVVGRDLVPLAVDREGGVRDAIGAATDNDAKVVAVVLLQAILGI